MLRNSVSIARSALRATSRIGVLRRYFSTAQSALTVVNPATEEVINVGTVDTEQSIKQKYQRARDAQAGWAARPFAERAKAINRFNTLLAEESQELAKTLTTEMGKPISQALNEINATPARIKFFLENTENIMKDVGMASKQNLEEKVAYEPLGVVANISAWNYPYFVGTNVFIPALLTGSTVLYKPSEYSSLTGLHITRLLHKSGVPEEVFQVVIGRGDAGAHILKQEIDGIFFTGSHATGHKIARAAADQLIGRVQLELGGKDPTYVCEDVDIEKAAASLADGAFYNTGQSCCSVERIYVHKSVYDPFLKAFERNVKSFVLGDPLKKETYIGPLARAEQIVFLEAQVRDAVAKGAKVVTGGKRVDTKATSGKGFYFQPTVLTNVNHNMDVMMKESFGPIIGIQEVANDNEAISLMNDNEYGLTAGVYTNNKERASAILRQVNSGTVYWNCCDRVSPRLPWSGRRHSGIGSTLGYDGIRAFLKPKGWHLVHGL